MGNGFWLAVGQMLSICFWTVKYLPYGGWRHLPKRALMFGLAVPVFMVLQCIHWLGFALDELFFRRYRKVAVHRPIFISGIPRSGTTHLHRVLARHDRLTSMQTWECLLAPSISERHLWRFVGRLFSPLGRWLGTSKLPFFKDMSAIHSLGLTEPEEDFLTLLPINACFLMVVLFPEEAALWRLARFDAAVPAKKRRAVMAFYRRMIQKHLYFHGADRRYLCKNPSFASWLGSLKESFPDADFILCTRPAQKTLPSQLSSLYPGWRLFHGATFTPAFELRIVAMLAGYYRDVELFRQANDGVGCVEMSALTRDLDGTVRALLTRLDLPLTANYTASLAEEVSAAQRYRSRHTYQQQAFRVRWSEVAHRFDQHRDECRTGSEMLS